MVSYHIRRRRVRSLANRPKLANGELTDKPGSVVNSHSSGTHVTARLKRPTRERARAAPSCTHAHGLPYLVLLRVGFTKPSMLPSMRCALTAPFHPYHRRITKLRRGGIFSVALSVGSRPPGVTWHPALWSPDFPPQPKRHTATVWPAPQRLSLGLRRSCRKRLCQSSQHISAASGRQRSGQPLRGAPVEWIRRFFYLFALTQQEGGLIEAVLFLASDLGCDSHRALDGKFF